MRVAVVANCQGEGVAAALRALNPGFDASFTITTAVQNGTADIQEIFANSDFVFAHKNAVPAVPAGQEHKLKLFPTIAFDGFHPDISFIRGKKKGSDKIETVNTDMVIYHSSIAFFGYFYGLSVDETLQHYNHYVMSRLGYADRWVAARDALLAEGDAVGMPLSAEFQAWTANGCFMYSNNHPHLRVLVDIARRLMASLGIPVVNQNVTDYLHDALRAMPIWPIYPPIAEKLGLRGDYSFKRHDPHGLMTLREFVERSYATYDEYEKDSLESLMSSPGEMAELLYASPNEQIAGNPYKNADKRQFWKNSVASVEMSDLDPVFATKFNIGTADKVATAGSCFAQHIARTLAKSGFDYYVPESAPSEIDKSEAFARNFGVFSARYGNIYTVRQLVQLIDRAYGRFTPDEQYWTRKDGALVDPFRPQIEPDGFTDLDALTASRDTHFAAVRAMLENMNVFVFTLGLTEGWRSKVDGAVFPLAPGVAGGELDFDRYEFVNFTAEEVTSDLLKAIDMVRAINPTCRVILTVSPVPLIATYEPQHALVSTTYSKSVLRIAAQRASAMLRNVDYFGSYEIITGSYNRGAYFHDDLRSVTDEGVAHVMGVFMKNYTGAENQARPQTEETGAAAPRSSKLFDIVCDEEAIANF